MGLFGNLFDFNRDGHLDNFEKAAEFATFMGMVSEGQKDELTSAGLDVDELGSMDESERHQAIEDAGLDPNDFDLI